MNEVLIVFSKYLEKLDLSKGIANFLNGSFLILQTGQNKQNGILDQNNSPHSILIYPVPKLQICNSYNFMNKYSI